MKMCTNCHFLSMSLVIHESPMTTYFPFELSLNSFFFCSKILKQIFILGFVTCYTVRLSLGISTHYTSLHFVYLDIDRESRTPIYKNITDEDKVGIGHAC